MQPKYWVMQPGHVRKTVMGLKCGAQNCTFMLLLIRYHLFFDNQVSLSKPDTKLKSEIGIMIDWRLKKYFDLRSI